MEESCRMCSVLSVLHTLGSLYFDFRVCERDVLSIRKVLLLP